jgi:hypothetical protein
MACYGHVSEMRTRSLLVLLLANIGCSFAMIRPSPHWDAATGKSECASWGYIAADAVGAAGLLLAAGAASAISAASFDSGSCSVNQSFRCTPQAVSPLIYLPGALLGASALFGGIATGACHHALPLKRNPDAPPIPIPDEPRSQPFTVPPPSAAPAEPAPAAPSPDHR